MEQAKHTPGPWSVGGPEQSTIKDQYSQRVADSFEGVPVAQRSDAECRANARLIAAAPELLTALQLAVKQNEHDMLMTAEELRFAHAAIAKATQ